MAEHVNPSAGDYDDPEPGSTWFISIASAIVFTALVLALSVLYYGVQREQDNAVVNDVPPAQITALRQEQWTILADYGRYTTKNAQDQDIERIRIPVSRAIELVANEGIGGAKEASR